jgi:hypothetical protein
VTLTARVFPTDNGGTVSFTDNAVAITGCQSRTLTSGRATCVSTTLPVGANSIVATYSGDTAYKGSTSRTFTQTINAAATATTLVSSDSSIAYGSSVTYTATVAPSPNGGTVSFTDGGVAISGCQGVAIAAGKAACLATPTLGTHSIVAKFSGSTDYVTSTSSAFTQTVTVAPTVTTLQSSVYPVLVGFPVTFTATVSPTDNGGTVSFTDGASPISGCQGVVLVAGQAACQLASPALGTHPIVATYSGDTDYAGSVSSTFNEVVTTSITDTTVTSSAYPITFGASVTYTATVDGSDGGGTVSFTDGGSPLSGCQNLALVSGQAQCVATTPAVGSHSIVATYSGDTDHPGSTSQPFTELVKPALASTYVSSSANPAAYGVSITYTATVTGSDGGGTVSFTDGGGAITNCQGVALTSGQAQCTAGTPAIGEHPIVATYSGDANVAGSSSPTFTETITGTTPTSTSLLASAYPINFGTSVTYTATVTGSDGGGTVSFTDGGGAIANCQGVALTSGQAACQVTLPAVGSHPIVATYSGDDFYASSTSATFTEVVYAAPTGTYVASSANPAAFGSTVTYTATVVGGDGGGTVSFTDNGDAIDGCQGVSLSIGQATCQVTASLGAHPIVATYSGDADFAGSASVAFHENVNPAATSVAVGSSANPAVFNSTITYTATVTGSDGGGTVSFTDNGDAIDGCQGVSLSVGQATCQVTAVLGAHPIVATYSGDTDYAGSSSSSLVENVTLAFTTTGLVSSENPASYGDSVTFTATVSGSDGGGTVSFTDDSVAIDGCQDLALTDGQAACELDTPAVGSHPIVATYSGDGGYASSLSSTLTQSVTTASTTTGVATTASPVTFGTQVTYTATVVGSDGGGTLSFTNDGDPIAGCQDLALVSGQATCQVTPALGSHTIVATYSGDTDYAGSGSNSLAEVVDQASTSTTLLSSASPIAYGSAVTYTATVAGSDGGGTLSFTDDGDPIAGCQDLTLVAGHAQCLTTSTAVGSHTIVATYSGSTDFAGSVSTGFTETVHPATTSVVVTSSAEPAKYGTAIRYTATVTGSDGGGTVSFTQGGVAVPGCQGVALSGARATCTVAVTAVGAHSIVATYSGDTGYAGSVSATFSETVQRATTVMRAKSTPKAARFGHKVMLQGIDLPRNATGTVAFTFGKINLCSARVVHGLATCYTSATLARGSYLVTARYSGDQNYVGVIKITRFTIS